MKLAAYKLGLQGHILYDLRFLSLCTLLLGGSLNVGVQFIYTELCVGGLYTKLHVYYLWHIRRTNADTYIITRFTELTYS